MLKVMGLIQRRPDLPLDAFRLHWRTIHRGLALRIAEAGILRGYVQNHRLDIPLEDLAPVADGSPELWFDDLGAFEGLRASPAFREGAFHDEPGFMRTDTYRSLFLEEEEAPAGQPQRAEVVGLLKLTLILGDLESQPSAGRRTSFVLPHGTPVRIGWHRPFQLPDERRVEFVETSWWTDLASLTAAWAKRATPVGQPLLGMLMEERPVFWPAEPIPAADWRPVPQTRLTR